MRKRIGCAMEKDGLYYLEESSGQSRNENSVFLSLFSKSPCQIKTKSEFITIVLVILRLAFLK